jgi:hypothetical protein
MQLSGDPRVIETYLGAARTRNDAAVPPADREPIA